MMSEKRVLYKLLLHKLLVKKSEPDTLQQLEPLAILLLPLHLVLGPDDGQLQQEASDCTQSPSLSKTCFISSKPSMLSQDKSHLTSDI